MGRFSCLCTHRLQDYVSPDNDELFALLYAELREHQNKRRIEFLASCLFAKSSGEICIRDVSRALRADLKAIDYELLFWLVKHLESVHIAVDHAPIETAFDAELDSIALDISGNSTGAPQKYDGEFAMSLPNALLQKLLLKTLDLLQLERRQASLFVLDSADSAQGIRNFFFGENRENRLFSQCFGFENQYPETELAFLMEQYHKSHSTEILQAAILLVRTCPLTDTLRCEDDCINRVLAIGPESAEDEAAVFSSAKHFQFDRLTSILGRYSQSGCIVLPASRVPGCCAVETDNVSKLLHALNLDGVCECDKMSVELQKSIVIVKIGERSYTITLEMLICLKLAFFLNIPKTESTHKFVARCNIASIGQDDIA